MVLICILYYGVCLPCCSVQQWRYAIAVLSVSPHYVCVCAFICIYLNITYREGARAHFIHNHLFIGIFPDINSLIRKAALYYCVAETTTAYFSLGHNAYHTCYNFLHRIYLNTILIFFFYAVCRAENPFHENFR